MRLVALAFCLLASACSAQDVDAPVRRFEIGGQVSNLGFVTCVTVVDCRQAPPRIALGAGASWNVTRHLSFDSSANFVAKQQPLAYGSAQSSDFDFGLVAGGRAMEVLAGPRVEVRGGRFGYFFSGKVGALSWSNVNQGYMLGSVDGYPVYVFGAGRSTFLVVQPSVGVDYALTRRVRLRGEVGQQNVHYHHPLALATATGPVNENVFDWVHSYTASGGVYVAVGRPLAPRIRPDREQPAHRFFDRTNQALFLAALLGESADAITTQRFLHHGIEEYDVFAKPFVSQGWAGQGGLAVLANGTALAVVYGLHRVGVHWAERLLPVAIAVASGYLAYGNLRLGARNVY